MSKKSFLTTLKITTGIFFLVILFSIFSPYTISAQNTNETANVVVESVPQSSVIRTLVEKIQTSWPWYVTRASGLVAGLLFFILLLSGTGFITGHTFNFLEPITAWASHKALGIALGISVFLHITALYFDSFVPFDIKSLLIPFVSTYRPIEIFGINIGSLYVALGVLAFYIIIAIVLTSLFWLEKKPKTWKIIHLLSYVAMIFIFVHALYLGTDLARGILRWIWIGLLLILIWASLARLRRAKTV